MNGRTAALLNIDRCVECGACQLNCPSGAVFVAKKPGCFITIIKKEILNKRKGGECCSKWR